jgi:hypothetical protein
VAASADRHFYFHGLFFFLAMANKPCTFLPLPPGDEDFAALGFGETLWNKGSFA